MTRAMMKRLQLPTKTSYQSTRVKEKTLDLRPMQLLKPLLRLLLLCLEPQRKVEAKSSGPTCLARAQVERQSLVNYLVLLDRAKPMQSTVAFSEQEQPQDLVTGPYQRRVCLGRARAQPLEPLVAPLKEEASLGNPQPRAQLGVYLVPLVKFQPQQASLRPHSEVSLRQWEDCLAKA
jgi:hypothetical protein